MTAALEPDYWWLAAVVLGTLGTALVFAGVTSGGLFQAGVVLIVLALVVAAAAGVLQLRADV